MTDSTSSSKPLTGINSLVEQIQKGSREAEAPFLQKVQAYLTPRLIQEKLHKKLGGHGHQLSLSLNELVEELTQETLRHCLERARRSEATDEGKKQWGLRSDGESARLIDSILLTEAGNLVDRHLGYTMEDGSRQKGLKTAPAKWDSETAQEPEAPSEETDTLQQAHSEAATNDDHEIEMGSLFATLERYDSRFVPIAKGVIQGLTKAEIAKQIAVSERTVGNLLARMRKIDEFEQYMNL